jgi:hypothetical protein
VPRYETLVLCGFLVVEANLDVTGRHFATNEITSFVALVIMLFDVEPIDGKDFEIPRKRDDVLPIHILEPVHDVRCSIKLRE